MCWLFGVIIIVAAVVIAILTNGKNEPDATKEQKAKCDKQSEEDNLGDLEELEMYIDEVDENGEPW